MMEKAGSENRSVRWIISTLVVLAVLGSMTLLTTARARPAMTITITNSSQSQIRNLYLAPGNPDDWGPDQLGESGIAPGGSFTLNNVSCEGSSIRVIAEDQNGCFIYHSVSCGDSGSWTITASETPDCGSN
jgi:hypothetical protein